MSSPLFHTSAQHVTSGIRHMRVKHRPPAEVIWDAARRKGWSLIDLADHMDGDRDINRALISMLFRDRYGRTAMGVAFSHRVALALGLSPKRLEELERDWFAYRRELTRSGRRLSGEALRRRRSPMQSR